MCLLNEDAAPSDDGLLNSYPQVRFSGHSHQASSYACGVKSQKPAIALIASFGLLALGAPPAYAFESDPSEFETLLSNSAPSILEETDDSVAPSITSNGTELTITPDLNNLNLPQEGELIAPPVFTVDFADGVERTDSEGVVELRTSDDSSKAFLQPLENGFRIVTTTSGEEGPDSFSYTLDVPTDSRLVDMGDHLFVKSGEETVGILEHPWAKDAQSNDVPTWYTLSKGVLTQHLDLSEVGAFPVVADPAWSYSLVYATDKSTYQIANLLGSCFNCYFPLSGAPRAFPVVGQYLPLTMGPIGFPVTVGTVSANPSYTWFQFSFYAAANHPDGPGSAISFTFENRKMYVYAWVTRDFGVGNHVNVAAASATWKQFATNLQNG